MSPTKEAQEAKEAKEEIFFEILDAEDGDYVEQALMLVAIKPEGWLIYK